MGKVSHFGKIEEIRTIWAKHVNEKRKSDWKLEEMLPKIVTKKY